MKDQGIARSGVSKILSPVVFLVINFGLCFSQTQSDPKKQPQGVPTQKTDFAVGKNPDAIIFDGAHIWVANQLGDNVMKLSASDGANLGTFATGSKPVALAYSDGVKSIPGCDNAGQIPLSGVQFTKPLPKPAKKRR